LPSSSLEDEDSEDSFDLNICENDKAIKKYFDYFTIILFVLGAVQAFMVYKI